MVGLVNRVGRTLTLGPDGEPRRSVKITGMDMGKLLMRHDCGWGIALNEKNMGQPDLLRFSRGLLFTGTAATVVRSIFDTLFLADVTGRARYFAFQADTDDTWEIYNYTVNFSSGPVWGVMRANTNEPYNILTTDTDSHTDRQLFHVQLFKMPIADNGELAAATTMHEVEPGEISGEDLGACDDERVTYELLRPFLTIAGVDERLPIHHVVPGMLNLDEDAVKLHGAHLSIIETSFGEGNGAVTLAAPADMAFLEEAELRSGALWERMRNNHLLDSGTIQMHLAPHIRAGHGINHLGDGKEYLVENITHHCVFGERPVFNTGLAVMRGQVP